MKKLVLVLFLVAAWPFAADAAVKPKRSEVAAWEKRAKNVRIVRDDWGIAHVTGKTDADAVFGMIYAQAEDDFNRVEHNYLLSMGRLAEAEGEHEIWRDLRMKLFIDPADMKAKYAQSPQWLKALMNAWADGLNYYLYKHPEVKPEVITRFEPWMALTFSEGSIGGDIERVDLRELEAFYGHERAASRLQRGGEALSSRASARDLGGAGGATTEVQALRTTQPPGSLAPARDDNAPPSHVDAPLLAARSSLLAPSPLHAARSPLHASSDWVEPTGSNGIAIAPKNTVDHHALLLINPHTSFFFRSELQMTSGEGLDAYGAVTWGQFFIYQGFNPHLGWMHTSSGVDNIDEYLETVSSKNGKFFHKYGPEERPVKTSTITVAYKTANGMAKRTFTVYRTLHGPVVREADGKWISIRLMQDPMHALEQSYGRTKATSMAAFEKWMQLHTNSSNNTVFADTQGDIAYFHSNFIPRRDDRFDWTKPVDGSNPATDWHGVLKIDESPNAINPPIGWLYNSNNWPWSAAGPDSPKRANYPKYVERGTEESPRGYHALRVLPGKHDFTIDSLITTAYDSYLPEFDQLLPPLLKDYADQAAGSELKTKLGEPVDVLLHWDRRWSVDSIPTALAIFWAEDLGRRVAGEAKAAGMTADDYSATKATAAERLESLSAAVDKLTADFGTWRTAWGEINRFQRINDDIDPHFDDSKPSIPVGFTSSRWGSLASFGAKQYPNTKKWYGTSGNSFVAVVEFGPKIRARAVTAGGESGHLDSKHFNDEAERYATGNLREVYFYPEQLKGHTEREYQPGK